MSEKEVDMYTLLREHRYCVQVGPPTHILRVEEAIQGPVGWGGKFRVQLPASFDSAAKTIYGASAEEAAESAARFIDGTH